MMKMMMLTIIIIIIIINTASRFQNSIDTNIEKLLHKVEFVSKLLTI